MNDLKQLDKQQLTVLVFALTIAFVSTFNVLVHDKDFQDMILKITTKKGDTKK